MFSYSLDYKQIRIEFALYTTILNSLAESIMGPKIPLTHYQMKLKLEWTTIYFQYNYETEIVCCLSMMKYHKTAQSKKDHCIILELKGWKIQVHNDANVKITLA